MGRDRHPVGDRFLRAAAVAVPAAFLGWLVVWPLVAVLTRSLAGVGIGDAVDVVSRPAIRSVIRFTFVQATVSTVATLAIGLPVAQVLARYEFRGRGAVRALVVVPFVLPTVVVASAFVALFDRFGVVSSRSFVAILGAHVFFNVAVVVRIVGGHWSRADRRIEEAARVLGADRWQTFRRVTVPRLGPVLAAASVLVFLFSFTSFGVIRILGGPARATIETEIYRYAVRRIEFDVAAILALVQLVAVVVLSALSSWLQRRVVRADAGRVRPLAAPVAGWGQRFHLGAGLAIAAVVVVSPLVVLVEGSLRTGDGYGLAHYRRLFATGDLLPVSAIGALGNSLLFAAVAAVVAATVGLVAAVGIASGGRLGRWLETVSLVPLGVSAVTLGFGYLVGFTVFDLRRWMWLVPISHAVVGLPFVLASVVPAMRSIDPRLREAAATLGASPWRVRARVDWPLVRGAALTGAGFAAAVSLGEFGATSFLARGAETFTAPLAIFRLMSQPGEALRGQALALSVIIGLVVAALAALLEARRGDRLTVL